MKTTGDSSGITTAKTFVVHENGCLIPCEVGNENTEFFDVSKDLNICYTDNEIYDAAVNLEAGFLEEGAVVVTTGNGQLQEMNETKITYREEIIILNDIIISDEAIINAINNSDECNGLGSCVFLDDVNVTPTERTHEVIRENDCPINDDTNNNAVKNTEQINDSIQ